VRATQRLVTRLGLALGLLLLLAAATTAAPLQGRVSWVVDGDTLDIAGIGHVRLLGIDTPEKETSERDRALLRLGAKAPRLREVARRATRYNIAATKGQTVTLEFDGERRDRYNRLLAYVFLPDGRLLNRLLLEEGLAVVYRRFDFRRKADFLAAEATAHRQQRGLWQP